MKIIRLIHTIAALAFVIILFILTSLAGLITYSILRLLGMRTNAYKVLRGSGRFLSKGIVRGMSGRVNTIGLDKIPADARRICIVSNHQSFFDIPLLVGYLPIWAGFIAKEELRRVPLLSQWMSSMECVYIRRGSARSSIKMILDGVKKIESGCPLIIFPEGTRSRSNNVNSFKTGSLKLATRSKSLLVPVTIQNTYQLWEEDNRVKPTDVYLVIHDPIDTSGITEEEEKLLPRRVEEIISLEAEKILNY